MLDRSRRDLSRRVALAESALAWIVIALVVAPTHAAAAQTPPDGSIVPGARVRVTAWGGPFDGVTIGRLVSRDQQSVIVLTCAECDTTRIASRDIERFDVHAGGNATAFKISLGVLAIGAYSGAVLERRSLQRSRECQGTGVYTCPFVGLFLIPFATIVGAVPGIVAAVITHERWWAAPVRPGPPP